MDLLFSDIYFSQLQIFMTVASEKSFSKAAGKLHLTQPAVTKSIARLERTLGFPLFIRTTRHTSLTAEGRQLYAQWQPHLLAMDDALKKIYASRAQKNLVLRVGTTSTANPELYFWPIAERFKKQFPQAKIQVESDSMEILREKLASGVYDIIFLPHFEHYSLDQEAIAWKWTAKDCVYAYMPKSHPLSVKKFVTLSDLSDYGLVALDEAHNPNYVKDIYELFAFEGLRPKITASMANAYTIKASRWNLKDIIIADAFFDLPLTGSLVRIPVKGYSNGIICAYRPDHMSQVLKDFLTMIS